MAGFLGLGGSGESFFLEPDDAKTMGDIDYMRTPKKVKRTFAKTKGWGDVGASERTISAYDERGGEAAGTSGAGYTQSTPSYYSAPATPAYTAPAPAQPVVTEPAPAAAETVASAAEPVVAESAAPEVPAEPTVEAAPAPTPAPAADSMDMFRAMARKIR